MTEGVNINLMTYSWNNHTRKVRKKQNSSRAWWCIPMVLATLEAEAGRSPELRVLTPAWATQRNPISKKRFFMWEFCGNLVGMGLMKVIIVKQEEKEDMRNKLQTLVNWINLDANKNWKILVECSRAEAKNASCGERCQACCGCSRSMCALALW